MILYDGAMGTYYRMLFPGDPLRLEEINLQYPERILAIHRAYLAAGATKIKSNTFALLPFVMGLEISECQAMLRAAWKLATEAVRSSAVCEAAVVADIGPHPLGATADEPGIVAADYHWIVAELLQLGAREFLFETQDSLAPILPACRLIQERLPEATVTVSFSANQAGFTKSGSKLANLLQEAELETSITYTGLNCDLGPTLLSKLYLEHAHFEKLQYLSPNSGLPEREIGRGRTAKDAEYFAQAFLPAWEKGATQLSGCCGTNPSDIKALAALFGGRETGRKPSAPAIETTVAPSEPVTREISSWYSRLMAGEKIIAVEYDSPANEKVKKYLEGVQELARAGADLLTIADCPIGRARMDSSLTASRIHTEYSLATLPHLTCRDRNLNATHALLLGLAAAGIHQVLIVTGDPVPLEDRAQIKGVFNTDSVHLIRYIHELNQELETPFILCAALNINARNFSVELVRAAKKAEAGAEVFLTQPIFTERAIENVCRARAELPPTVKILAGIMPLVSYKNASYMQHEMSGMDVPEEVVKRYEGLDRTQGEELAVELSLELMAKLHACADGFYLMTPFQRSKLTARICQLWKNQHYK